MAAKGGPLLMAAKGGPLPRRVLAPFRGAKYLIQY